MELLLNLAWLLLAVPAYWLWRGSRRTHVRQRRATLECLLSLACVLVILFPVVSATDDLHAMRAEMEESAPGERGVRQTSGDRSTLWHNRLQNPPALQATMLLFTPSLDGVVLAPEPSLHLPNAPLIVRSARAPPSMSLA
jgi:hypothetical protein